MELFYNNYFDMALIGRIAFAVVTIGLTAFIGLVCHHYMTNVSKYTGDIDE